MEYPRWCKWFLVVVVLFSILPPLYKGVQWVWSIQNLLQYIFQSAFLLSAVILINFNRNREEAIERSDPTPDPTPRLTVATDNRPRAKISGTKRETRLQKDFLATAPSKRLSKARTGEKTAVTEAVRENIKLMEKDLMVTESSLLDELQIEDYLTENEVSMMKNRSRKDQTHLLAERIEALDDRAFLGFLKILDKSSFGHIAKGLKESHEKHLPSRSTRTLCPVCRIRSEVDIKELRCDLKEQGLLPSTLYSDINCCLADKNHQNALWEALFFHLKQLKPKEDVLMKFINFFNTSKHEGLFNHLLQYPPFQYVCTCRSAVSSLERDSMKPQAFSTDASEESNTSSIDIFREPENYLDAVNTSSSESGPNAIHRTRKMHRTNKHCNRVTMRGNPTGPKIKNKGNRRQQNNHEELPFHLNLSDGSTTSSLDSNPGSNFLLLSKLPSKNNPREKMTVKKRKGQETESNSKETTHEAMDSDTKVKTINDTVPLNSKRSFVSLTGTSTSTTVVKKPRGQGTESNSKDTTYKAMDSDTEVKTINDTATSHFKRPIESSNGTTELMNSNTELQKQKPVFSVRPYISESDVNSSGEARKIYSFPRVPVFKKFPRDSEFAGECIPTAFAKTIKSQGISQLW